MTSTNPDLTSPFGKYLPSLLQRAVLALIRIPPLYRGTLRPFWVRVLNFLRAGPVDVVSVYGKFRVYPTTNLVESALLLHPHYNQEEIDFLKQGLPTDGVFVDIGAKIGLYSVALANFLGPQGRVVAIEPKRICSDRLRYNCEASGIKNCSVQPYAVGDYTGRANLNMLKSDLAIVNTVRVDAAGAIPVRPLLDILAPTGITRIDALKIDIEGYEYAALAPFFRDAPRQLWPRAVSMEHLGEKDNVVQLLAANGYTACGRTRNNAQFRRTGSVD